MEAVSKTLTDEVGQAGEPAEVCGETKLYVCQVHTKDKVKLALWRCEHDPNECLERPPVILVPGTYSNRRFWISRSGKGLAPWLYRAGYDVWLVEPRGHGRSDGGPGHPHPDFRRWTIEDLVRFDLPAVAGVVSQSSNQPASWVGHSYGGIYLLAALSLGAVDPSTQASVVTCGSQWRDGQGYLRNRVLNAVLRGTTRLLGRFPAKSLGMGSENEPPRIMNEAMLWKRDGAWMSPAGTDYSQGLEKIDLPVLSLAGRSDTMDPVEGCRALFEQVGTNKGEFRCLGRSEGYARDYGHVDMLIGADAEREIWPEIEAWIGHRVSN